MISRGREVDKFAQIGVNVRSEVRRLTRTKLQNFPKQQNNRLIEYIFVFNF